MRGATLGIVGLGEIGRPVARIARGFALRVVYTQRRRLAEALEQSLGAEYLPLDDLLSRSDFVSLHVPLSAGTRHLIGARELGRMRPGAVLVNTARGQLVDEAALIDALKSGHLAGAGLDVRHQEPPGADQLTALPNVVLSPHVAAGTGTELVRDVRAVLENIASAGRSGGS